MRQLTVPGTSAFFEQSLKVTRILLLAVGVAASAFVAYRHFLTLRTLPKIKFSPQQLALPLSLRELTMPGMRWVEVEVSAVPSSAPSARYRDTLESPQTLILQFGPGAQRASPRPVKYRGILYNAVHRSAARVVDPLIQELRSANIRPQPRFAVLMVDESPWLIWKAVLKELGVLLSTLVIVVFLLAKAVREVANSPARRQQPIAWLQAVAISASVASIAWAIYSSFHSRPVLPIGTILGLGLCAVLTLASQNLGEER
jgi:hypothetical protein